MHPSLKLLVPAVCLFAGTACMGLPFETDSLDVQAHYPTQHEGPCHSWLKSAKTGSYFCASPAWESMPPLDVIALAAAIVEPIEELVDLEHLNGNGERIYNQICIACHQEDGMGLPGSFPPLGGSGDYYGDPTNMAGIIINGLSGEITVQGQPFNGVMPPQGAVLTDYQIAAVTTYVRTHFGNDDGMVTPDDVAAAR